MRFMAITKWINKVTGEISSWVLFLMMMLSVCDVIGRYVFHSSIFGAQDITQLMMVVLVFLGFGLEAEEDGNVRIEILYQRFSEKTKSIMNIIAWIVALGGYTLVAYNMYKRAFSIFQKHNASTITLKISLAPFLLIAAIGCTILVLQLVTNIILDIYKLKGKCVSTEPIVSELTEGGNEK